MSYLIDGHNLVPHVPSLALQDLEDELQLIQILQVYCNNNRRKAEVFFDNAPAGRSGPQRFGRVTAHFVRGGSSADDAIRRRLSALGKAARNWIVVSSDREVQQAARQAGAQALPSEEFAHRLDLDTEGTGGDLKTSSEVALNEDELEEWLRLFGEEE